MGSRKEYRAGLKQLQLEIDYKVLGRHLQTVRKKHGITQVAIAEQMKVGEKYYTTLESGKGRMSLARLIQFICITHASADYLLSGTHAGYPLQFSYPKNSCERRDKLNRILDQCSEDTIETLCTIAERLQGK